MSDSPRNDETPEYRDPTAPSDPSTSGDSSASEVVDGSIDFTSPIETNETREVPAVPPFTSPSGPAAPTSPPANPAAAQPVPPPPAPPVAHPGGQPAYGPAGAAPQNPYAAPPAGAGTPPPPQNPYSGQQYPTQGQVQGGYQQGGPPQGGYAQGGYAGAPAYGTPAYGAPGYGQPTYAAPRSLSGNTIALLVVSGLSTLGCLFGIPALVFAIIAATKKDDPAESAKYTKWGWIAYGVTLALAVIAFGAIIAFAIASDSTSSYDSGY